MNNSDALKLIWRTAIESVTGREATASALASDPLFDADLVIAVGKAAGSMALGALESLPRPCPALVVTKYDHADASVYAHPNVTVLESAHPIPDEESLKAGALIQEKVQALNANEKVLFLVSGGASALVEHLQPPLTLRDLQVITNDMMSSGADIGQINTKRKEISQVKGGKLLEDFPGRELRVYAISDVQGDDIKVIGSGIGDASRAGCVASSKIIASNLIARTAAANKAAALNFPVQHNEETLYGDVFAIADMIAKTLMNASPGVYIWGGEPTIRLPEVCGSGGRNQSLSLLLAQKIFGRDDITILTAGTDGTDGPTDAAGGVVNGKTCDNLVEAQQAIERADAGSYLRNRGDIFITGPTNTNVMDLVIALVSDTSGEAE